MMNVSTSPPNFSLSGRGRVWRPRRSYPAPPMAEQDDSELSEEAPASRRQRVPVRESWLPARAN